MRDNQAAIEAVRRAMTQGDGSGGWSTTALGKRAGVSENTVRTFLTGETWPRLATLGKIETALGWPAGRIEDIALGHYQAPGAAVAPSPVNDDGQEAEQRPSPIEFSFEGMTIVVHPNPNSSPEEVRRNAREIFDAAMERIMEMKERGA